MKFKLAGIVLACVLVIVGAWAFVHAQTTATTTPQLPVGANGRYQVIAADIDSEGFNGEMKHKTAIRIDTQTGHTWDLVELPVQGGGSNWYWMSLNEDK
jgi:hypothetical protein